MPLALALAAIGGAHLLLPAGGLLAAEAYRVSPANSSVEFTIGHLVISSASGEFKEFEGTIRYDAGDIANSSLTGSIDTASIDTGNETRDEHLRSADYFDVQNHPKIRFETRQVQPTRDGGVLVGDLTMRGVRRQIEIPFTIEGNTQEGKLRFTARLELNRQDYGIAYGGLLDGTVGDIVSIELSGEAAAE